MYLYPDHRFSSLLFPHQPSPFLFQLSLSSEKGKSSLDINQPFHNKLCKAHLLQLEKVVQLVESDPKAGNRVSDSPCSHLSQESHMKTKLHNCCICVKDLSQPHACSLVCSSVSVSPYWPRLSDTIGFLVKNRSSLRPVTSIILFPFYRTPQISPNVWL